MGGVDGDDKSPRASMKVITFKDIIIIQYINLLDLAYF